jgi:hypothetical protein
MISARAIVLQNKLASNYKIIPYKSYDMGIMRPLSNLFSKTTHVQEFRLKLWLQSDFKIILLYLPYRIFMFEFWRQNHWPFRSTLFKTIQTYHVVHSCCCSENHGLRTPNEGINQGYLKNWADVADKICFGHIYQFGIGIEFSAISEDKYDTFVVPDRFKSI